MYYNLLPQLKNASLAGKKSVTVPYSKMDLSVAKVLTDTKYLHGVQKKTVGKKNFLEIVLVYRDRQPVITEFKLISKPSRHIYSDWRSIRLVRQGYGIGVFSTSRGIMTGADARKNKLGGEYLFQIF